MNKYLYRLNYILYFLWKVNSHFVLFHVLFACVRDIGSEINPLEISIQIWCILKKGYISIIWTEERKHSLFHRPNRITKIRSRMKRGDETRENFITHGLPEKLKATLIFSSTITLSLSFCVRVDISTSR